MCLNVSQIGEVSEKSAIFGWSSLDDSKDPNPCRVDLPLGIVVTETTTVVRSTVSSRLLASSHIVKQSKVLLVNFSWISVI